MILPIDVNTNQPFMGSIFRNSECETILRNIIMLQKKVNPEQWTPFTWEEYKAFCTHNVTPSERGVLTAFVDGGKSVSNTSTYQESGWLEYNGLQYSFSQKMIEMIERDFCKNS